MTKENNHNVNIIFIIQEIEQKMKLKFLDKLISNENEIQIILLRHLICIMLKFYEELLKRILYRILGKRIKIKYRDNFLEEGLYIIAYFPENEVTYCVGKNSNIEINREDLTIRWIGYAKNPREALRKLKQEDPEFMSRQRGNFKIYRVIEEKFI